VEREPRLASFDLCVLLLVVVSGLWFAFAIALLAASDFVDAALVLSMELLAGAGFAWLWFTSAREGGTRT
jgi:hypothetical protein